jgi:hypothetical protein
MCYDDFGDIDEAIGWAGWEATEAIALATYRLLTRIWQSRVASLFSKRFGREYGHAGIPLGLCRGRAIS